jgi:hypothetical protein
MAGVKNPQITKTEKITPKHQKQGVEVNICQVFWFEEDESFSITHSPPRISSTNFLGSDLNYLGRVLYAESSGAQALASDGDRKMEKEALINVFYFRLNRKGYPSNRYIATTFSMVCNAPNQFQSVLPNPSPKLRNSSSAMSKNLNKMECSDLQESLDAIRLFLSSGPNNDYVYDNFRAGSSGTRGTTIGGSRFWLSSVGKELSDETP